MPAWMTPEERPVWWAPIRGSASSTQRRAPGRRESSSRATAWPTMPPPTIATSHSAGGRSLPVVVAKRGRLAAWGPGDSGPGRMGTASPCGRHRSMARWPRPFSVPFPSPAASVRLARGVGGRARLLRQRGDLEHALGGLLEHLGRLLGGAGVELDQQVDDDLVLVVLVEADVGEELAHPGVAEGAVGEELGRVRAGAALDPLGVDLHRAGGDPGGAGDHPRPALADRRDAVLLEGQVRLVVHAVEALDHRFLHLVDAFGERAGGLVDAADRG